MIYSLLLALSALFPQAPGQVTGTNDPVISQATGDSAPGAPLAVDGVRIPWEEFANWLVFTAGENNLERYINEYLLQREFKRAGLVLDEAEVRRRVEDEIQVRVNQTFGGNRDAWLAELARLGQDKQAYLAERMREVRLELLEEKLVQSRRVVTQENVRAAWEETYGPGGRSLAVSRILLRVLVSHQAAGKAREAGQEAGKIEHERTRARAQKLYERMQAEGEFDKYVREFSDDLQTRETGGALGAPVIPEDWPGVPMDALLKLNEGELLPPFFSRGGFNLFRLDRIQTTPFEKVAEDLGDQLRRAPADQQELATLAAGMKQNVMIERLEEVNREATRTLPRFNRPVAVVDGEPLLRGDFARWLVSLRGLPLAQTFAQQRWAEAQAKQAGCEPSALEVEQRVQLEIDQQVASFFGGDREEWARDLVKKGRDLKSFMRQAQQRVRHNLRAEGLMVRTRVITDEMVRRQWQTRYGEDGNSLDIRFLMRAIPNPAEGSLTTVEQVESYIAEQSKIATHFLTGIAQRVQDGEDFAALVRTHSHDPVTRDRGGRGPGRFEVHTWPEAIQKGLRELQPGQVLGPIEMGQQFFLFELAGRVHVPLEDVAEDLREELRTQAPSSAQVAGFVNEATRSMRVEILPPMTQ